MQWTQRLKARASPKGRIVIRFTVTLLSRIISKCVINHCRVSAKSFKTQTFLLWFTVGKSHSRALFINVFSFKVQSQNDDEHLCCFLRSTERSLTISQSLRQPPWRIGHVAFSASRLWWLLLYHSAVPAKSSVATPLDCSQGWRLVSTGLISWRSWPKIPFGRRAASNPALRETLCKILTSWSERTRLRWCHFGMSRQSQIPNDWFLRSVQNCGKTNGENPMVAYPE